MILPTLGLLMNLPGIAHLLCPSCQLLKLFSYCEAFSLLQAMCFSIGARSWNIGSLLSQLLPNDLSWSWSGVS